MSVIIKFNEYKPYSVEAPVINREVWDFVQQFVGYGEDMQTCAKDEKSEGIPYDKEALNSLIKDRIDELIVGVTECVYADVPITRLLAKLFNSKEVVYTPLCSRLQRIQDIVEDMYKICQWLLQHVPLHLVISHVISPYLSAQFDKGREFQQSVNSS